jgi:hypothetical protein
MPAARGAVQAGQSSRALGRTRSDPGRAARADHPRGVTARGPPGRLQLYGDGTSPGTPKRPSPPVRAQPGALTCGANPGSPVTGDYASLFKLTGTTRGVTVDVSAELIRGGEAELRVHTARQQGHRGSHTEEHAGMVVLCAAEELCRSGADGPVDQDLLRAWRERLLAAPGSGGG